MTAPAPLDLDLTIVTGMSGAGRSTAADVLEDLGFFVIDNLPPGLIPKVTELAESSGLSRMAFVVDARSGSFIHDLADALAELRSSGARTRTLFLDASDDALVRRFEESRRVHPLAGGRGVHDGIVAERRFLEDLKGESDVIVDTSALNVHQLRDRLRQLFDRESTPEQLQTRVVSFGYKHGIPTDVDLLFDCRFLPNPHWVPELRPLPGTDPVVQAHVLEQPEAKELLDDLERLLGLVVPGYVREGKAYLTIGVGCTGGRHRSVVIAEALADVLRGLGTSVRVQHRDLDRGERG
jgi:UPF0042 nucleotide-binding protein